jgi:hypothetical protein
MSAADRRTFYHQNFNGVQDSRMSLNQDQSLLIPKQINNGNSATNNPGFLESQPIISHNFSGIVLPE